MCHARRAKDASPAIWNPASSATVDLESGTRRLAEDPCGAAATGTDRALLSVDGVPWLWEFPDGGGHTLARIDVAVE